MAASERKMAPVVVTSKCRISTNKFYVIRLLLIIDRIQYIRIVIKIDLLYY